MTMNHILRTIAVLSILTSCQSSQKPVNDRYLLVGTYTSYSKSEGIYVYRYNSETGSLTPAGSVKSTDPFLSRYFT